VLYGYTDRQRFVSFCEDVVYVKLVLLFASHFLCSCKTVVRCCSKHKASAISCGLQLHSAVLTADAVYFAPFLTLRGHLTGTDQINHVDVETKITTCQLQENLCMLLCRFEIILVTERKMHIA
jgi:hypothetical protein